MESNNEIEPTNKDFLSDSSSNGTDRLPLVIDNFEHFPAEILLPIFSQINDIDLVNLASVSTRFEPMVREVFAERYADKYFVIKGESKYHQTIYSAIFNLFGGSIRAIEANGNQQINDNHWIAQLLNKHTPNLEKLCFKKCSFMNIDNVLLQHMNITHLAFHSGSVQKGYCIKLPEYCNLKSLELFEFSHITTISLKQVLCNNPFLERFFLSVNDTYFTLSNILKLVYTYLKHLKELYILDWHNKHYTPTLAPDEMVQFTSVLTTLKLFGFMICNELSLNLLEHVYSNCTNITHLELCDHWRSHRGFRGGWVYSSSYIEEIFEIIYTLNTVEILTLISSSRDENHDATLTNVPNLHDSSNSVSIYTSKINFNNDEILEIVRKCKHLKRFIMKTENFSPYDVEDAYVFDVDDTEISYRKNVNFHDKFIATKLKPNFRIEFSEKGRVTGIVTKEEIIWRNKLLHWVGYDPIYSRSNVRLLDLANVSEGTHKTPLNLIFNYLDLDTLYSFSMASKKSKQSVYSYIQHRCKPPPKKCTKQRAIQRGKFFVTNEFGMEHKGLQTFGKCMKYLEVNLLDCNLYHFRRIITEHCKNLTILCLRTRHDIDLHRLNLPQVRHLIFYGYGENCKHSCDLSKLSQVCPNLEILEIRTIAAIYKETPVLSQHLQKIRLTPLVGSQLKIVKKLPTMTKFYINNAFKFVKQYR